MLDFDWVTVLDKCSPAGVFEKLRLQVEEDVKVRNELMSPHGRMTNQFLTEQNGGTFTVLLNRSENCRRVIFELAKKGVTVRNEKNKVIIDAAFTLNAKGECRPEIEGKECEFWQLRMKALKDLFDLS